MSAFLNKTELCKKWKISPNTLEKWIHDGLIKPIKPGESYFSPAAVETAEKAALDTEQFKPLQMARMRKENERLQQENAELRSIINHIISISLP